MKITIKELRRIILEAAGEADDTLGIAQRVAQLMATRARMFDQAVQHLAQSGGSPEAETKTLETLLRLVKGMRSTLEAVEPVLQQKLSKPRQGAFQQPAGPPQAGSGAFNQSVGGRQQQ